MKTIWLGAIILAAVTGAAWGQALDLSGLDKLEAKAKEVNNVTLDKNLLHLAGGVPVRRRQGPADRQIDR